MPGVGCPVCLSADFGSAFPDGTTSRNDPTPQARDNSRPNNSRPDNSSGHPTSVDQHEMSSDRPVCPRCEAPLTSVATPIGARHTCDTCGGEAISEAVLERLSTSREVRTLLSAAVDATRRTRSLNNCPWCSAPMQTVRAAQSASTEPTGAASVDIDVCAGCQLFWFDAGELATLPTDATIGTVLARPVAIRCESCGAPARPDLDASCAYCGHRLAPATIPEIVGRPDGGDRNDSDADWPKSVGIGHGLGAVAAGVLRAWLR